MKRDDVKLLGPVGLARAWGMNPIHAAATVGFGGGFGASLRLDPKKRTTLEAQGGLQALHGDGPTIADEPHGRALVRSCMLHLVRRTQEGPREARINNLTAGLGDDDRQLVHEALSILQEMGVVRVTDTFFGQMVAVVSGAEGPAAQIARGNHIPERVSALWQ